MLKPKNKIVGRLKQKSTLKGKLNNLIKYEYPPLENLEVTPSAEEQIFTHEGSYGYDKVTVKASDSAELEASYLSIIDGSLGENVTKLPNGLTRIREYAFRGCSNLKLSEIPNEVTSIGSYAFYNCSNVVFTKLPDSLTNISQYAFFGCSNINIKIIPETTTSLGLYVFCGCSSLTEVTFLGKVTSLSNYVFSGCTNLAKLVFPNVTKVVTISSGTLNNTPIANGIGYVYVPDDLVDKFKTATNWSAYGDQIKPLSEMEVSA